MITVTRMLMFLILLAGTMTLLVSFDHTNRATVVPKTGVSRLLEFPLAMKNVERSLLALEQSIHDLDLEMRGITTSTSPQPTMAPEPTVAPERWRKDQRCGKNAAPLPDGKLVECDPDSDFPCCSALGWCGATKQHCHCKGCVSYKAPREPIVEPLKATGGEDVKATVATDVKAPGATVLLVIPFRDRESHLALFKQYWRWFAENGRSPKTVRRWLVYISEQFDSQTFNRGWNFNGALAIAASLTSASGDIQATMRQDFDCAVIQDIDYLPEKGVDYAECEVPMQLSAEIDRYNWKTPYMTSAGGIVGMSLKHWRAINGFGNNYFGWGGEDDELHHRLRLNGLLYGDCYPYCGKNDQNVGKPGQSIKRPRKGFGRFSGKFMHSANHTKRITDSRAYAKNLEQLREIGAGGHRWKTDGLNSLSFSIVEMQEDRRDEETYGIVYRHVKLRRGKKPFHVKDVPLAIPPQLCSPGSPSRWVLKKLGSGAIPWDLEGLRSRVGELLGVECPGAREANFILVDRRQQVAKVFHAGKERMLVVYLRSLHSASEDALIVADLRPVDAIHEAFQKAQAFAQPPTFFSVCTSKLKKGHAKYSVHQGDHCSGGGWDAVQGGTWRAYAREKAGTKAVSWCDNEKYWTQIMVQGPSCPQTWNGLKWIHGGTFYVRDGNGFCTGTRKTESEETSFSKLLAQKNCATDGYSHDISFQAVLAPDPVSSVGVCVGEDSKGKVKISMLDDCDQGSFSHLARFSARRAASENEKTYCITTSSDGDLLLPGHCDKAFAVPPSANQKALRICVGTRQGKAVLGLDEQCESLQGLTVDFLAPSLLDIAASTQSRQPLLTIVEEEVTCFGFLCPHVLSAMK